MLGFCQFSPAWAFLFTAPEKKEESRHPEPPERPLLGELTVAGATADSLRLSWTVAQGSFDSFVVQYKDAQGRPQAVPVRGDENEVAIPGLEPDRKYKMNLYGLHGRQRMGPVSVVATTGESGLPRPPTPSRLSGTWPQTLGASLHLLFLGSNSAKASTVSFPTSQDFASSCQPLTSFLALPLHLQGQAPFPPF